MTAPRPHRILLTGSYGFLASRVRELIVQDSSCEGLFLSHLTEPQYEIGRISGDPELSPVREAILSFRPTCVLNLAWAKVSRSEREDPFHLNENVVASKNLYAFIARHFPSCRLVGIGSQAELGPVREVISPTSLGTPLSAYGRGKSMARDFLCSTYPGHGVWLRLLTLYGPHDHEEKFVPYILRCLQGGVDAEISPGEQVWDFLHVDDAARALLAAAKAPELRGIHVVASGEAWSLKRVAELLFSQAREHGSSPELHIGARPYASHELMQLEGDSRSFVEATGWLPRIPLEAGLRSLADGVTGATRV